MQPQIDRKNWQVVCRTRSGAHALDLAMTLGYMLHMTRVRIGDLRDRVSRYIRRAEKGETIVIVNRDREVAVLRPWRGRRRRPGRLLGALNRTPRATGDIVAPTHTEKDWFRT